MMILIEDVTSYVTLEDSDNYRVKQLRFNILNYIKTSPPSYN